MKSFAIVLVCYNRINGLKRLAESLLKADYSGRSDIDLIFSIDNSGTKIIEEYARGYEWPFGQKYIRTFENRQGLKNHVLQCGDLTEKYDVVCVLEDDLYVSNCFFQYASQAADFYWNDDSVAGISLYTFQKNWLKWHFRFEPMRMCYDTFFMRVAMSWGQVWTSPKWKQFKKWYNENSVFIKTDNIPEYLNEWPDSSWLKYHTRYCIETNRYFVYPYDSLSTNFSDAGSHANRTTNDHQVELIFDKADYNFPLFSGQAVIYDEYMDRIGLGEVLGVPDEDLTVDFYNTKRLVKYKRFLLSTSKHNYLIVDRFALSLRPIEASVLLNIKGEGIYLYDTTMPTKNHYHFNPRYELELYFLRSHEFLVYLPLSVMLACMELFQLFSKRLKKLFNVK